jgi:hypothetical protein
VRSRAPLSESAKARVDETYRDMLRSMKDVDDMVGTIRKPSGIAASWTIPTSSSARTMATTQGSTVWPVVNGHRMRRIYGCPR